MLRTYCVLSCYNNMGILHGRVATHELSRWHHALAAQSAVVAVAVVPRPCVCVCVCYVASVSVLCSICVWRSPLLDSGVLSVVMERSAGYDAARRLLASFQNCTVCISLSFSLFLSLLSLLSLCL